MRAVAALYSSEHQARSKQEIENASMRRMRTIQDMREYLRRTNVDLSPSIAIVHVTGTKGKGSTACLCESILRERNSYKTGMLMSPHLVDIRERIRIGGRPVSQAVFGNAYWNVRRMLEEHANEKDDELPVLPGYFRMLFLLAVYILANYEHTVSRCSCP
jgi:folylpolyglutamate synthase